jgi:hypothetical protein
VGQGATSHLLWLSIHERLALLYQNIAHFPFRLQHAATANSHQRLSRTTTRRCVPNHVRHARVQMPRRQICMYVCVYVCMYVNDLMRATVACGQVMHRRSKADMYMCARARCRPTTRPMSLLDPKSVTHLRMHLHSGYSHAHMHVPLPSKFSRQQRALIKTTLIALVLG